MITDAFVAANESAWRLPAGPGRRPVTLCEAADDDEAFVLLTDGIFDAVPLVLADGLERARDVVARLKRRDFYTLVSRPKKLPTLPICAHCSTMTRFTDKFCAECGARTDDRPRARVANANDGKRVFVPALVALTEEAVLSEVLKRLPNGSTVKADHVSVKITSIKHGWKTTVKDRGVRGALIHWETYDPVANVLFFNPKEDVLVGRHFSSDKISSLFIPTITHERVLYCYFKGSDPEDLEALTDAYDAYVATLPGDAHVGTSNPSPSPFPRKRKIRDPDEDDARPAPRDLAFSAMPDIAGRTAAKKGAPQLTSL